VSPNHSAYVGRSQSHTALPQSVGQPASLLAKQPHTYVKKTCGAAVGMLDAVAVSPD